MRATVAVFATLAQLLTVACETGQHSGRGLRLPPGDVERGELAFREIGCRECHDLAGERTVASKKFLTLGGSVSRIASHGELITAIVNPSHELSYRFPPDRISKGGRSQMKNFNERMTVAQLIDITTFLQTRYYPYIERGDFRGEPELR